jgi:hypothetical protein
VIVLVPIVRGVTPIARRCHPVLPSNGYLT